MTRQGVSTFAVILLVTLVVPLAGWAQTLGESTPAPAGDAVAEGRRATERWETTLDGRVGVPIGRLKVGESSASSGAGRSAEPFATRMVDP